MINYDYIRETFEEFFLNIGINATVIPENVNPENVSLPYIIINTVETGSQRIDISNQQHLSEGFLIFYIHVEIGSGTKEVKMIADEIHSHIFNNQNQFDNIKLDTPTLRTVEDKEKIFYIKSLSYPYMFVYG